MHPIMNTAVLCLISMASVGFCAHNSWVYGATPPRLLGDEHSPHMEAMDGHRMDRLLAIATAVLCLISMASVGVCALCSCLRRRLRLPQGDAEAGHREMELHSDEHITKVKALPMLVYNVDGEASSGDGGEECAVCLAEYAHGDEMRVLPGCHHRFHRECIDQWLLMRAPTCPVCRGVVIST